MFARILALLLTCLLLASCGGGGPPAAFQNQVDRADLANQLRSDLATVPGTAYTAMPTSGSATFGGYVLIGIDPVAGQSGDDLAILGDLELTARFEGRGQVTGRADNLVAQIGSTASAQVTGDILIGQRDSQIGYDAGTPGRLLRPNEWVADYGGRLGVGGAVHVIAGELDGQFLGTRPGEAAVIRGVSASGAGTTQTGAPYGITIFAEN